MRTLIQAFRTKELRNKILFTIGIIIIYRIGAYIPTPGVDYRVIHACLAKTSSINFVSLINLFSGGSLLQLSVFALGIMPYITASIVVELLRAVIPRFEALHREGQAGEAKLTQYTRYMTIGLAVLQSATIIVTARSGALFNYSCSQSVIPNSSIFSLILMVLVMTGGTGLIMWMAELITEKGIGQGMSVLIFISICAGFLPKLWDIGRYDNWLKFSIVLAVLIAVIIFVIFVEQSQRRVPVQYTRRMIGRKMYGGTSTYIPLKINMSGVIPPIFASSILAIPTLIAQFGNTKQSWVKWVDRNLGVTTSAWYIVLYAFMIIFFTFFYASITFNSNDIADDMKEYGGFVPGIRAGYETSRYLSFVMDRLDTVGSIYLLFVCLIPTMLIRALDLGSSLPFGGTTILIIAGVGLDTLRQAAAQVRQFQYKGFLVPKAVPSEPIPVESE
ncbi:MAG: preprotein translocase subunit SecY [Aeriscardovia sp.]|nr:preprotein translocase subunit SecY [Aeriscardovia sp.]MBQ1301629.1 preprotein translocase subunit SecY [Aeriscardovia sp.]MBQ1357444.1 preprotein translocase subunit SecY [Aeriscardovia sp.]MBQ5493515.1 preprotein translocase subunit SecY [Aeriscardovia sp.]MBQ5521158.1 preprotein translocase subunit SecY [Aeriscardovia sp.]